MDPIDAAFTDQVPKNNPGVFTEDRETHKPCSICKKSWIDKLHKQKTGRYRWRCSFKLIPSPDCPRFIPKKAEQAPDNDLPIIQYCKKAANYRVLVCPHCKVGTDYAIADTKTMLSCHGCGKPFVVETELVSTARKPTVKEAPPDYVESEVEAAFVDELKIKKTDGGGGGNKAKIRKPKPKHIPWYQR